ncbi:MAG: phosphodiester glycosidase family protein [Gemmatimonadaceae bacterium]
MRRQLPILLLLACAAPLAAQQSTPDSTVTDTVAPGIVHTYYVRQAGPWRVHVVSVALRDGAWTVRSVRALDSLRGREATTRMVERAKGAGHDVKVAINADFFELKSGETVNNQVSDGRIWKALAMSGKPGGAVKTARGQFGITRAGKPVLDRFVFAGVLRSGRRFWSLDGVNAIPSNGEGLVLWLPEANGHPRADSLRRGRELAVRVAGGSWRDSLLLQVTGRVVAADSTPVPAGFGVLVAYGATAARLDTLARDARTLSAHASWLPTVGPLEQLVGGWPVILRDGYSAVEQAVTRELTLPGNAAVRHPRSLIGFDADTSHLYLVAVDGRTKASVGMTLAESAGFLYALGITQALNLDGGGSTTLVINGKVVNTPSDPAGERPVGNALLIERRRP